MGRAEKKGGFQKHSTGSAIDFEADGCASGEAANASSPREPLQASVCPLKPHLRAKRHHGFPCRTITQTARVSTLSCRFVPGDDQGTTAMVPSGYRTAHFTCSIFSSPARC